jgi:hypothetical protein
LKTCAAQSGTSVSGLIERAVRLMFQTPAPQQPDRFDLVTFGEDSQFTPLNIDKTAAHWKAMTVERYGRQR